MNLKQKALLVFGVAFVVGGFAGFTTFRVALSFTSTGEQLQQRFDEACLFDEPQKLKVLYLAGAFPNGRIIDGGPEGPTGYPPDPPLHQAASYGNAEVVKWLLDHGANVNSKLDDGESLSTPLDEAEWHLKRSQDTVDILKAHGGRNANAK